jgi:hypothetical protein
VKAFEFELQLDTDCERDAVHKQRFFVG